MSFQTVVMATMSLIVLYKATSTLACEGYRYEEKYLRGREGNEFILTDHQPPTLTDKCTLKLNGCVEVLHDVKGPIQIEWNITKDGNQELFGSEDNMCDTFQRMSDNDKTLAQSFGIPLECPMPKGKVCKKGDEVSVEHHRSSLIMMDGSSTGWFKITTKTGVSIFEFSGSLVKTT